MLWNNSWRFSQKIYVENCIEWLDLIIEPLEYVNKNDNAPMMDRLKLWRFECLKSTLERIPEELGVDIYI